MLAEKSFVGSFVKFLFSVISLFIALIPSWFLFTVLFVHQRQGFWQNLDLTPLSLLFLGTIQACLLIIWFKLFYFIWEL